MSNNYNDKHRVKDEVKDYFEINVFEKRTYCPIYDRSSESVADLDEVDESYCPNPFDI